jgi:MFS family permease
VRDGGPTVVQGPLFPGMSGLQGLWIPNREFTRASSLVGCMWSGGQAITKVLAPLIIVNYGWEWCYRGFGLPVIRVEELCALHRDQPLSHGRRGVDPGVGLCVA